MTKVSKIIIMGLIAELLVLASGCSGDSTAPKEATLPEPNLNSLYSRAGWVLQGAACQDGQFCLSSLIVQRRVGGDPEICVQLSGDAGTISQSTVMSSDDFDAYFNLVSAVIVSREYSFEGCISIEGLSETVDTFGGDAGWSARIEGCDEQIIEELRDLNRELFAKYFGGN